MDKKTSPFQPIDCIVVGGAADGMLLKNILPNARFIELARPQSIKPLKTSDQQHVEVNKETEIYEVHIISLQNTEERCPTLFSIAVVKGQSLTWAFSRLVIGYVENATQKMLDETPQIKH